MNAGSGMDTNVELILICHGSCMTQTVNSFFISQIQCYEEYHEIMAEFL